MNYLDLTNNVLRRMRHATVESIGETDISQIVADIVNDAKRQVEDSWDWQCLRTYVNVPTVSGTQTYSLTGTQNRATILQAINTTNSNVVTQKSQAWGREDSLVDSVAGIPVNYTTDGVDSNGDTKIKLYPSPDGIYHVNFHLVQRTADLEAAGDETSLPSMPIIYLAYAMASREEGETGGAAASELFAIAARMLSDAIAQDSALNPSDLVFYEV